MRATLAANGVPGPLPWDVAVDVAEILLLREQTIYPARFIDSLIIEAENARRQAQSENLPHNRNRGVRRG